MYLLGCTFTTSKPYMVAARGQPCYGGGEAARRRLAHTPCAGACYQHMLEASQLHPRSEGFISLGRSSGSKLAEWEYLESCSTVAGRLAQGRRAPCDEDRQWATLPPADQPLPHPRFEAMCLCIRIAGLDWRRYLKPAPNRNLYFRGPSSRRPWHRALLFAMGPP